MIVPHITTMAYAQGGCCLASFVERWSATSCPFLPAALRERFAAEWLPVRSSWVGKWYARVRRETRTTVGEVGLERGIGFAVRDRPLRGCGTEERAARRAVVRLGRHTLRYPRLPEHRRQGGGRCADLRCPGGNRYRGRRLLLGTAGAIPLSVATSLRLLPDSAGDTDGTSRHTRCRLLVGYRGPTSSMADVP